MSAPRIPQDLIDCILDEIRHRPTLKSCAAVARSFRSSSQKHLYSHIKIDLSLTRPNAHSSVTQLQDNLTANPALREHIRSLDLRLPREQRHAFEVGTTLRMLPRLRVLDVRPRWHNISREPVKWALHSDALHADIYHLLQGSYLEVLYLQSLDDFPLDHISHCSHLKRLSLINSISFEVLNTAIPLSITLARIEPLDALMVSPASDLASISRLWSQPPRWIDVSRLRELSILEIKSDADIAASQEIVESSTETLRILALSVFSDSLLLEKPLKLASLTQLRSIRLTYCGRAMYNTHWFRSFLDASITAISHLDDLRLDYPRQFSLSSWNEEDQVLANAPCLEKVHIGLTCEALAWNTSLSEFMEEYIPLLVMRRNISLFEDLRVHEPLVST